MCNHKPPSTHLQMCNSRRQLDDLISTARQLGMAEHALGVNIFTSRI
jgi:hypothetical protein